jgi:hypothetical protein
VARSSEHGDLLADADGRLHHLLLPAIKSGGQGAVYQTREPNIGVKILKAGERAADIVRGVRRLPIEDLVSIAAPLSTLQDRPGYVMVWLRGMVPLSENRLPTRGHLAEIVEWYIATGGLRRRLALSARLAEVLADLHGRGLVYVDLSMANVMVSDVGSAAEVRLIDLDNLRSASDQTLSVLTERWAAPELFKRQPPSRHSDVYSLALVVFTVLTGYHPFDDGDLVRYTPEESPERIAAARGHLPSFIDPEDSSNTTTSYLFPLDVVLTPMLLETFQRAFGPGRQQVDSRPTAATLRRMLWEAHDRTVTCSCGFTTYLEAGSCAACDKPFNDVFTIEILASPSSPPVATIAIGSNPVAIQRRHLPLPTEARTRHDDVVQASIEHGAVVLDAATEWSCGTRTLRHGDQTELTNNNGTSMTLRAVAYAS